MLVNVKGADLAHLSIRRPENFYHALAIVGQIAIVASGNNEIALNKCSKVFK